MSLIILILIAAACTILNFLAFAYGVGHGIGYYLASFPILGGVWLLALIRWA